jgi:hypothetical protein
MANTSFFTDMLVAAMAELSAPITAAKMLAAFKAAHKVIPKSRIAYQWRKENP